MSFKLKNHEQNLLFVPLGGSGEIGMNLNLYQHKGKWIVVDMGAGFPDDFLPGANIIIPDTKFIRKIKKDLLGIVLTHSHEDHFGAIQYLLEEIDCPVYATKFTANLLKRKIAEYEIPEKPLNIQVVKPETPLEIGSFKIDFVPLNHSIPEMYALFIETDEGVVMHTGDWKFDHNPMIGQKNDEKLLKKWGEQGVLALVGDSTNIFDNKNAGSEGDLRENMIKMAKEIESGLIVVTTFASNVARLETITEVAKATNRKIIVCGRSLWRLIEVAKESGYLKDTPEFYEDDAFKNFPREEILVMATGCQGEQMAAMNKICSGQNRFVRLSKGDHVIFSSKIIPGNEKRIFRLFDELVKNGVETYTERDHFVHVSGHPGRPDLKKMYDLIKPNTLIPVHGQMVHMHEHVKFGKEQGIENVVQVENGAVVKISKNDSEIVGYVDSGVVVIDGKRKVTPNSHVMKARRRITTEGSVVVTLLLDDHINLCCDPIINCLGLLDGKEDEFLLKALAEEIEMAIADFRASKATSSKKAQGFDARKLEQNIRAAIRRIAKNDLGKNPPIEINMISDG